MTAMEEGMVQNHEHYASNAKANTGVSLGAVGTGLGVLSLIGNGMSLFGNGNCRERMISKEQADNNIELTKAIYQQRITDLNEKRVARELVVNEFFNLYKSTRDNDDKLREEIGNLKCEIGQIKAVQPYKDALFNQHIEEVRKDSKVGLAIEAQNRFYADQLEVLYMNSTFNPVTIATQELGTTTVNYTPKQTYNPLYPFMPMINA